MPGQVAGLELRHRQHARVEDWHPRTEGHRPAQPALSQLLGQRRLAGNRAGRRRPGHLDPASSDSPSHPELARVEITTFRYRVLHVAARITRSARKLRLRIDATWRWAAQIVTAWQAIRTAFG